MKKICLILIIVLLGELLPLVNAEAYSWNNQVTNGNVIINIYINCGEGNCWEEVSQIIEGVMDSEETQEPATEEPATEELITEEPATEEPATEEPGTEEPVTEELTMEESGTEEQETEELADDTTNNESGNESTNTTNNNDNTNNADDNNSNDTSSEVVFHDLRISEIYPYPNTGESEWVKVYNSTNKVIDLSGYYFEDGAGYKTQLSGSIDIAGSLQFDTKNLNNSGDLLYLKNVNGGIIDWLTYGEWELSAELQSLVSEYPIGQAGNCVKGESTKINGSYESINSDNANSGTNTNYTNNTEEQTTEEQTTEEQTTEEQTGATNNVLRQAQDDSTEGQQDTNPQIIEETVTEEQTTEEQATTNNSNEVNVNAVQAGDVIINEIQPDPNTGVNEWVELFNNLNYQVDLANWVLEEGSGQKTILSGEIAGRGYLVFDKRNLNNDGDVVILRDNDGEIVDKLTYGVWDDGNVSDNAPKSSKGNSIIFYNNSYFETLNPTKGGENILQELIGETAVITPPTNPTETVTETQTNNSDVVPLYQLSNLIRINEFLPDPVGSDTSEWIEIYNSGNVSVNLKGWSLDDAEGGSKPYKIDSDTIINSQDYFVFSRESTGLALNNDKDRVAIINPEGTVVSSYEYIGAKEGYSWAYFDDGWQMISISTPAEMNEKPMVIAQAAGVALGESVEKKTVKKSTTKAVKKATNSVVTLSGQVLVSPNILEKSAMYVVDDNQECWEINLKNNVWPKFEKGQASVFTGVVKGADFENTQKLYVANASDINGGEVGEEISDNQCWQTIEGELSEKKGRSLFLTNEDGEYEVYLKQLTKLDPKDYNVGEKLKISGLYLQSKDEKMMKLLPTKKDDIVVILPDGLATGESSSVSLVTQEGSSPKSIGIIISIFVAILVAINLFLYGKKRFGMKKMETANSRQTVV